MVTAWSHSSAVRWTADGTRHRFPGSITNRSGLTACQAPLAPMRRCTPLTAPTSAAIRPRMRGPTPDDSMTLESGPSGGRSPGTGMLIGALVLVILALVAALVVLL